MVESCVPLLVTAIFLSILLSLTLALTYEEEKRVYIILISSGYSRLSNTLAHMGVHILQVTSNSNDNNMIIIIIIIITIIISNNLSSTGMALPDHRLHHRDCLRISVFIPVLPLVRIRNQRRLYLGNGRYLRDESDRHVCILHCCILYVLLLCMLSHLPVHPCHLISIASPNHSSRLCLSERCFFASRPERSKYVHDLLGPDASLGRPFQAHHLRL